MKKTFKQIQNEARDSNMRRLFQKAVTVSSIAKIACNSSSQDTAYREKDVLIKRLIELSGGNNVTILPDPRPTHRGFYIVRFGKKSVHFPRAV